MSHAVAPEHALWALLHDATEAYLGDMIRPLKQAIPAYRVIEDRLMQVICGRFGIPWECPQEVKDADNRILVDERAALLGPPPLPWASIEDVPALGVDIGGWQPRYAERRYLDRLNELWPAGRVAFRVVAGHDDDPDEVFVDFPQRIVDADVKGGLV